MPAMQKAAHSCRQAKCEGLQLQVHIGFLTEHMHVTARGACPSQHIIKPKHEHIDNRLACFKAVSTIQCWVQIGREWVQVQDGGIIVIWKVNSDEGWATQDSATSASREITELRHAWA